MLEDIGEDGGKMEDKTGRTSEEEMAGHGKGVKNAPREGHNALELKSLNTGNRKGPRQQKGGGRRCGERCGPKRTKFGG
jgi:hypothetical protein